MASAPPASNTPRTPPLLEDLFAELTWPTLWKAARLSLRPARVGFALIFILAAFSLLSLADRMDGASNNVIAGHGLKAADGLSTLTSGLGSHDYSVAAAGLITTFVKSPYECFSAARFTTVLFFPALLLLTAITGGAICRTAATELAWSRPIPWPTALAMGLSRWRSLLGALLLPLGLIWIAALVLAVAGWALFNVGALSIVGGLFWLVFLAVGVVVGVIMLGLALGHWMLVPAVVCEGADAIDAGQHTLSLVFARPLRLLLYLLMLLVQGLLLGLIVGVVITVAITFAKMCAGAWLDAEHIVILKDAALSPPPDTAKPTGSLAIAGSGLVRVSTTVLIAAGWAVMVSYVWCAATALFLAMRRVCDGQDIGELWSPGMIDGTTTPPPTAPIASTAPVSEAITDNGPADDR